MKQNTKYTIKSYVLLIIFVFSYINFTQIVLANGQINYQFIKSPPFKIGYGTDPEFPTTGNLRISLKVNYIDSAEPMIKGNISFIAKQPNQNDYSINKNMRSKQSNSVTIIQILKYPMKVSGNSNSLLMMASKQNQFLSKVK